MPDISDSYPNDVPLELCIKRQWKVVGDPWNPIARLILSPIVHESARELKQQIDESRRYDRAILSYHA